MPVATKIVNRFKNALALADHTSLSFVDKQVYSNVAILDTENEMLLATMLNEVGFEDLEAG